MNENIIFTSTIWYKQWLYLTWCFEILTTYVFQPCQFWWCCHADRLVKSPARGFL